jgi:transposase
MKRKTRQGRKTLLNTSLQAHVCKLLREGCNVKTACNISGIGETTYHEWKNRGRSGEQPYASFFSETSRARDTFKASLLKIIVKAADKEARHAEWLLERYWPNEFGRSEPREIILVREPAPLPVQSQSPEVRTETRWTKEEIPFSKAQLKYLSDLRRVANNGGDADEK